MNGMLINWWPKTQHLILMRGHSLHLGVVRCFYYQLLFSKLGQTVFNILQHTSQKLLPIPLSHQNNSHGMGRFSRN